MIDTKSIPDGNPSSFVDVGTLPTVANVLDSFKDFVENEPQLTKMIDGHLDNGGALAKTPERVMKSAALQKLLESLIGLRGMANVG